MTPSITLYAELLLHIRTVTLFASLRTAANRETKATLVEDGETITVKHDGEEASIRLPTRVGGGGDATLTIPEGKRKELTLRLQLEEKDLPGNGLLQLRVEEREGNFAPWGAAELASRPLQAMQCRSCWTSILRIAKSKDQPGVSDWKDLPNENWAEMMDFWHCHKPDDHSHGHAHPSDEGSQSPSEDHNGQTPADHAKTKDKGYAASNKLRARPGTGFIDLTHLLLYQDDCCGIKVSATFQFRNGQQRRKAVSQHLMTPVAASPIQVPNSEPRLTHRSRSYSRLRSMGCSVDLAVSQFHYLASRIGCGGIRARYMSLYTRTEVDQSLTDTIEDIIKPSPVPKL